jgi:hypothetical protein
VDDAICCRYCGCTDEDACELQDGGGCFWAWPGLCSVCLMVAVQILGAGAQAEAANG